MEQEKKKTKTVKMGDTFFRLPFVASGFYVSDADGNTVAECRTQDVAKALASTLNTIHN
jgi:hypothetical protein